MTNEELIAKIKAEIERLKAKYRKYMYMSNHEGLASGYKIEAYNELLSFLSTLESEKPVPNDLEEAAEEYADCNSRRWQEDGDIYYDHQKIVAAFIAGTKWQADHAPLPEDTVLFNKGVEEGKRLMMEDFPKWLVDDDYDELTDKGKFILGSAGLGYNGYYIPYSDLLKLPKED